MQISCVCGYDEGRQRGEGGEGEGGGRKAVSATLTQRGVSLGSIGSWVMIDAGALSSGESGGSGGVSVWVFYRGISLGLRSHGDVVILLVVVDHTRRGLLTSCCRLSFLFCTWAWDCLLYTSPSPRD